MLTQPLFNSIETRYPTGLDSSVVRDVGPQETLRIVYRDTDLHLYVLPTPQDPEEPADPAPGSGFELHVVHTKITRFSQQQIVFEGFAVPEQPGRAYPRIGVTLRHRADLAPHAEQLAALAGATGPAGVARRPGDQAPGATPPASYAGFTRLAASGGVTGLDLPYVAQRSPEQAPTRGTVFVDLDYLARYARTDAAGGPVAVHDPDAVRRLAMTSSGLARRAVALDSDALLRTDTFTDVWNALFAPLPGERPV